MSCDQDKYVSNDNKIAILNQTYVPYSTSCMTTDFGNHKEKIMIGLITVFDAILMGRQSSQKLKCLYGNPIVNNFYHSRNPNSNVG